MKSKVLLLILILISIISYHKNEETNYYIEIIEYYTPAAEKIDLIKIIDGDTIEGKIQETRLKVRIVGYDAYELNEAKGLEAKAYLESVCSNAEVYLEVDSVEPKDKYNRTLGYLWCRKQNQTEYLPVTKAFLILRPDLIKRTLYIPPDKYPYFYWTLKHEVRIISEVTLTLRIYNITGTYEFRGNTFNIALTGSYYALRSNLFLNATNLNLLKEKAQSITISTNIPTKTTETLIVTEKNSVTLTITEKNTKTLTVTKTETIFTNKSTKDSLASIIIIFILLSLFIIILIAIKLRVSYRR